MEANTIDTAKITSGFIKEQAADWSLAAIAVEKTATAYLSDIESRKNTLQAQAKGYEEEMSALGQERNKIAAQIADLSSRGQIDGAAVLDTKLEAVDQKIHTLRRKIKIVNGATPKGDPVLYTSAQAAYNAMTEERAPYLRRIDELSGAVQAEIDRLKAVKKELSYARDTNPGYHAAQKWTAVDRHYRDLDRIEQEAAERAAAERNAQEAARGHTSYTIVP